MRPKNRIGPGGAILAASTDLSPSLLRSILRQARVSIEELLAVL